jgi:hypothetical protein
MRVPDIPNWVWHEYGQRVGFWRLKRVGCRRPWRSAEGLAHYFGAPVYTYSLKQGIRDGFLAPYSDVARGYMRIP